MRKRGQTASQSALPFLCSPDTSRTLEIHCGKCGARFIALYGTEKDAVTEIVARRRRPFVRRRPIQKGQSEGFGDPPGRSGYGSGVKRGN